MNRINFIIWFLLRGFGSRSTIQNVYLEIYFVKYNDIGARIMTYHLLIFISNQTPISFRKMQLSLCLAKE